MTLRARTAVVVGDTLEEGTLRSLGDACTRLGAVLQVWNGKRPPDQATRPALIIAGLAAGARQLSDEVLELADRRFPGTQVLLVCDEPLARPTLTLQQGRITLIEPPPTVERMASRIRLLLSEEPDAAPRGALGLAPPAPGRFTGQEFRRPAWWTAGLACASRDSESEAPSAWLGVEADLTAVLTSPDDDVRASAVQEAIDLLRLDPDGEDCGERLAQTLGRHAGMVHLTADRTSWLIYWPCSWQPLWLFSTQRLPRWSCLAPSSDAVVLRLAAVPGDVIAGLSSAEPFAEGGLALPSTAVSAAMLDGGPALLALFEDRLTADPRPFSCVLAEVR